MPAPSSTVDGCTLVRRELSHRLAMPALGFATAAVYLFVIAYTGLFDELVVGVFVPLTMAFELGAQTHVDVCQKQVRNPNRHGERADAAPHGRPEPSPGYLEAGTEREVATRITILSVLAAALTTAIIFVVGTSIV